MYQSSWAEEAAIPYNHLTGVYTPPNGAENAFPGEVIASATWNSIFTDLSGALTFLGQQQTPVQLTDQATITFDMSTLVNAFVTLGGNRTLGNPTNPIVGQTGLIRIIQDVTGSRTLALGSSWKTQGGTGLALTATAGATDLAVYCVWAANFITIALSNAYQ